MDLVAASIAVLGFLGTSGVFAAAHWDARRVEIDRPLLWATIAAVPVLVGVGLYLFATVPTTGVIMTANTGIVLYTFEREVRTESAESEEPVEPGALPHQPVGKGSTTDTKSNSEPTSPASTADTDEE